MGTKIFQAMATTSISRTYIITGAGRGIGRGLSRLLLAKGHRVLLLDNNISELQNTSQLLKKSHRYGVDFYCKECNITDRKALQEAVQFAKHIFDEKLDCLINNAADTRGVGGWKFEAMKLDDWNAALEVNLTAPMVLSQLCLPLLRKTASRSAGGNIIHISSTRALQSEPDNEAYATSKAGLLGLTQSMAVSLADNGIRVNAILPGWIHVGNENKEADEKATKWEEGLSEEDQRWHLTGRVGKVEDVAKAVEYLVENEGVSGSQLMVDGGVTRKMVYPE